MLQSAGGEVIQLLTTYRYFILLPLSIIEGPIMTVIGGFLVVSGLFNPFAVYGIIILGDILGDTIAYSIGKFGGIHLMKTKFGKFLGVTQEKLEEAKNKFQKHHKKTLIFSKLFHGFGLAGLITAGILKINYWKYLITCVSVTMIQAMILLIIGILFGSAYQTFGRYISYFAETTIAIGLCVIIYLIARNRIKSKKHENLNS